MMRLYEIEDKTLYTSRAKDGTLWYVIRDDTYVALFPVRSAINNGIHIHQMEDLGSDDLVEFVKCPGYRIVYLKVEEEDTTDTPPEGA